MSVAESLEAAPSGMNQCEDFIQFELALRKSRGLDDKIIQALNNSLPTASRKARDGLDPTSQCQGLWKNLERAYELRERAIEKCVGFASKKVQALKEEGKRSEARHAGVLLNSIENEMTVEKVVQDRTKKVFHEKCRDYLTT